MDRRGFLKIAGSSISSFLLANAGCSSVKGFSRFSSAKNRPNIILIMADDLGYEALSCNGAAEYQTIELDRLARQGIRFTNCYSQPLCTPSRVKIMTGRYNIRNYKRFGFLYPDEITFANIVKKVGYKTCIAGKWQLGKIGPQVHQFGFDTYCLWSGGFHDRFMEPNINVDGTEHEKWEGKYGPDVFSDHILNFIEENQNRPFFAYYPMALTHDPFVPSPDHRDYPVKKGTNDPKYFADMIAYTDKIVGRIDRKLEELGIRENTILMFTGDNGTGRGIVTKMKDGRDYKGGKGDMTNAGTHVPFIASFPGKAPRGKVCDDLIDFSDFFVTIAEATGAALPSVQIDGVSFLPQLMNQQGPVRDYTYCFHHPNKKNYPDQFPLEIFVRDKRWKLYHDARLFDLLNDPLEEYPIPIKQQNEKQKAAREKLFEVLTVPP